MCGDAIGGRVNKVLNLIDPQYARRLESFPLKNISSGWTLFAPNGKSVDLGFVNSGYVSKREDFDNFLLELVKEKGQTNLLENFNVQRIVREEDRMCVQNDLGERLCSKIVIGCDGAQSVVAKQLAGFKVDLKHYSGAVRAYYTGIEGIKNQHYIEVHLVKNFLPGYFWIFPIDEKSANVGFGMLSEDIGRRRINLKSAFNEIVHSSPGIAERFANASQIGKLNGFGLPLGGATRTISGNRYMLCGDAASLIDPLNGEGIGNAMWSGYLASRQAEDCFRSGDFSAERISAYDKAVYSKLGKELRNKLFMQKAFNRAWLINALVQFGRKNPGMKNCLGRKL